MQVLQSGNFDALLVERVNAPRRCVRRSQRSDTGYIVANRGAPNRFLIVERFAAERRVDDQIDFSGFDQIHDIGAAFVDLEDRLRVDPGSFESRSRATRGEQAKTERSQLLAERAQVPFVAVVDTEKHRAFAGQTLAGGELRLGKGLTIGSRNAHDFAGRAHLGSKNRVYAAEFVEWKNRRFHRIKFA